VPFPLESVSNQSEITAFMVAALKYPDKTVEHTNGIYTMNQFATLYPNPCSHYFKVHFNSALHTESAVNIYDFTGRLVLHQDLKARQTAIEIDVSGLASGLYYIEIQDGGKRIHGKFIKE
jgi:hypothetical protein